MNSIMWKIKEINNFIFPFFPYLYLLIFWLYCHVYFAKTYNS